MAVKRTITEEQRAAVNSIPLNNGEFIDDYEDDEEVGIQIPDFLGKKREDTPLRPMVEEFTQAILNNTPGNTEAEEQNHLNQLEEVAINYSEKEWNRILLHAPSDMMSDELKRRLGTYEDYIRNTRSNMSVLADQKL